MSRRRKVTLIFVAMAMILAIVAYLIMYPRNNHANAISDAILEAERIDVVLSGVNLPSGVSHRYVLTDKKRIQTIAKTIKSSSSSYMVFWADAAVDGTVTILAFEEQTDRTPDAQITFTFMGDTFSKQSGFGLGTRVFQVDSKELFERLSTTNIPTSKVKERSPE